LTILSDCSIFLETISVFSFVSFIDDFKRSNSSSASFCFKIASSARAFNLDYS
jgi:hypothetical protein